MGRGDYLKLNMIIKIYNRHCVILKLNEFFLDVIHSKSKIQIILFK